MLRGHGRVRIRLEGGHLEHVQGPHADLRVQVAAHEAPGEPLRHCLMVATTPRAGVLVHPGSHRALEGLDAGGVDRHAQPDRGPGVAQSGLREAGLGREVV